MNGNTSELAEKIYFFKQEKKTNDSPAKTDYLRFLDGQLLRYTKYYTYEMLNPSFLDKTIASTKLREKGYEEVTEGDFYGLIRLDKSFTLNLE